MAPLFLLSLAGVRLAAAQPATRPTELGSLREKLGESAELALEIARMPDGGAAKLRDVLRLDVERGTLVLRTSLPPNDEPKRFRVDGLAGATSIHVRGALTDAPPREPQQFTLTNLNLYDPGAVFVFTTVHASAGHLLISAARALPAAELNVQVLEDRVLGDPAGARPAGVCRLYVQANDAGGRVLVDRRLEAKDLADLLRHHPRDAETYVRPMFEDLGLSALLAPEPAVAWQVFAPAATVDETVRRQVVDEVARLDAGSFRAREHSMDALRQLGAPAAVVLLRWDRKALSDQQRSAVDVVLAPYHLLSDDEAAAMRTDAAFLVRVLGGNDPALRRLAAPLLDAAAGRTVAFPIDGEEAAQAQALTKLRRELFPPIPAPL